MSTPMFQTGRRKIAPTFGGFTPAAGRGISLVSILCLAAQILRWPWLGRGGEKRGLIFAPTHGYLGRGTFCPSTCAKIPKNATTHTLTPSPTHSGIALHRGLSISVTHTLTHSLTPRSVYRPTLIVALRPTVFALRSGGTYPGTAAFGLTSSETRTIGTVPGVRPAKPAPYFLEFPAFEKARGGRLCRPL